MTFTNPTVAAFLALSAALPLYGQNTPGNRIPACPLQDNSFHGIGIPGDATGTLIKDHIAGQRRYPGNQGK